jgi:hypothetical protein
MNVVVRRAVPVLRNGWSYTIAAMPYGIGEMTILYCGELASASMLPLSGNSIGDAFLVGEHLWVLAQPPGFTHTAWVDP